MCVDFLLAGDLITLSLLSGFFMHFLQFILL